jgi:hypothetical protein
MLVFYCTLSLKVFIMFTVPVNNLNFSKCMLNDGVMD